MQLWFHSIVLQLVEFAKVHDLPPGSYVENHYMMAVEKVRKTAMLRRKNSEVAVQWLREHLWWKLNIVLKDYLLWQQLSN